MFTFLDEELMKYGIKQYINVDFEKSPMWAIAGATGTGKTYGLKLLLARISKDIPKSTLTICDYKGDSDFAFLSGVERFYRFDSCYEGLTNFYESFLSVQKSGNVQGKHFFVFDEWASFLINLDKKEADDAKKKLSALLMLGRSFGYHVILSQQRLDAEYFGKTRDNFSVLVILGNPSKEVQEMCLRDFKDSLCNDRQRGTGYMVISGSIMKKIVVPQIMSMERVEHYILDATLRNN